MQQAPERITVREHERRAGRRLHGEGVQGLRGRGRGKEEGRVACREGVIEVDLLWRERRSVEKGAGEKDCNPRVWE